MRTSELDYTLPDALIAREPPAERDGGRLLVVNRATGRLHDAMVRELPALLPPRSLVVVNDTRVIPARLHATKPTGGKVELLLTERTATDGTTETWRAMARPLKSLRVGTVLSAGPLSLEVTKRESEEIEIQIQSPRGSSVRDALARVGELPIPPYMERAPTAADAERYQTVFAREEGAVAAPTAGLHLSPRLLEELASAGHGRVAITLHVGAGTFLPIRTDDLSEHVMHEERYLVSSSTRAEITRGKRDGRTVVGVGTTVVRALEAGGEEGRTSIFIYPPYRFRTVDVLMTNFHLPRSTLLALVMAFGGIDLVREAYAHALREKYRFYSYGDAMLIL